MDTTGTVPKGVLKAPGCGSSQFRSISFCTVVQGLALFAFIALVHKVPRVINEHEHKYLLESLGLD